MFKERPDRKLMYKLKKSDIYQYSQTETADFNKDLPSSKH